MFSGALNTQSKHYKLFRTLPLSSALPTTPLLPHSYSAARPASAGEQGRLHGTPLVGGSMSMPLTPASPAAFHTPLQQQQQQPPPPFLVPPTATPRSALTSPRTRRPATAREQQSAITGTAVQAYQAAFLTAQQQRHLVEADRLALFNRLAHLRAAEDKTARRVAQTAEQIRAVHAARERHAREAAERQQNLDWFYHQRREAADEMRIAHAQRKEAFKAYKIERKHAKQVAAQALRNEGRELVSIRQSLAEEHLSTAQLVRSDLQSRTARFHERQAMKHQYDQARVVEIKALRIQREQALRTQAEEDLLRMEVEERELLARAAAVADEHKRALDELAGLVLRENKHATLRAQYVPISELQGRGGSSARKKRMSSQQPLQPADAAATFASPSAATPATSSAAATGGFSLSMPSAQAQQAIYGSASHAGSTTRSLASNSLSLSLPAAGSSRLLATDAAAEEEKQSTPSPQQQLQQHTPYSPTSAAPNASPTAHSTFRVQTAAATEESAPDGQSDEAADDDDPDTLHTRFTSDAAAEDEHAPAS